MDRERDRDDREGERGRDRQIERERKNDAVLIKMLRQLTPDIVSLPDYLGVQKINTCNNVHI